MDSKEFSQIRKKLQLTQVRLAEELDKSIKAIQAYEQGRIRIPALVQKVMGLLDKNIPFRNRFINKDIDYSESARVLRVLVSTNAGMIPVPVGSFVHIDGGNITCT